jgi:hypothetical protein
MLRPHCWPVQGNCQIGIVSVAPNVEALATADQYPCTLQGFNLPVSKYLREDRRSA